MSESLWNVLITSLTSVVTAALTAYIGFKIEQRRLEIEQRRLEIEQQKLENERLKKDARNKKEDKGNKEDSSSKEIVKNAPRQINWKFLVLLAFVMGGVTFYALSKFVFMQDYGTTTPTVLVPTDVNTPTLVATNTPTAIPVCPNAKVKYLELFISPGKWNQYYPDQNGKINPSLSQEDLGTLTKLSGLASLVNAGDCSCTWRGSLQSAPFEPINNSSDCHFSINISNSSERITRVNLELTIGNNQPTLFTISLP